MIWQSPFFVFSINAQIVLARDGGISEVKYLLPEVVGEIEASMSEVNLDHPGRSGRKKSINEVNSTYLTDLLSGGFSLRKSSVSPLHNNLGSQANSRVSSRSPTRENSFLLLAPTRY